jgi:uncharacterized protein YndB with AHSA1/START domain
MAKFKFVGFQEHVEIPDGYELLEVQESIHSNLNRDALFILIGTPNGLSQWFYKVHKLDARPGGKFSFEERDGESSEGRCTAVTMGREISLLADSFGQVNLKITSSQTGLQVEIAFAILTDKKAEMSSLYQLLINQLKEQL